jgi:hypothetical protein
MTRPSFKRSISLFWMYTLLRFGLWAVLWLILWLVGLNVLLAGAIAAILSLPLSWVLLARPRAAFAANIEQRVSARVHDRAEFDAELAGEGTSLPELGTRAERTDPELTDPASNGDSAAPS